MYGFDHTKIDMSIEGLKESEFPSFFYVKNVSAKVTKVNRRAKYDRVVITILPEKPELIQETVTQPIAVNEQ